MAADAGQLEGCRLDAILGALAPVAGPGSGGGTGDRWHLGAPSPRSRLLRPIGWADDLPPPSGLRTYPRAPIALSLVDSVVFGRDTDESGNSYYDENFKDLFRNSAGSASWEQVDCGRAGGKRTYANCPAQQSLFSKVAFPGTAASGAGGKDPPEAPLALEDAASGQDFGTMFQHSAGMPSWATTPRRGLKRIELPGTATQMLLDKGRDLPPEWKLLVPKQRSHASARAPTQPAPRRRSISQRPPGRVIVGQGQSLVINSSRRHQ